MAGTAALPKDRLTALNLLASGMSRGEVAKSIGKSYKTVQRWEADQDFAAALSAEVERRRRLTESKLQEAADEVIAESVNAIRAEMAEFHKALVNVQKQRLSRGKAMQDKAFARLQDLPSEAIAMKDVAPLILAGDRLIEKGLDTWGDVLAVADLLERLGTDGP
jgi:hypothetical protein